MSIEVKQIFENELKQKLLQKTRYNLSESTILLNSFKFYDLSNSGVVTKDQWIKSIAKIGLSGFSERDLSIVFDIYDSRKQGIINYRNFLTGLYSNQNQNQNSNGSYIYNNPNNQSSYRNYESSVQRENSNIEDVITKIRNKLTARGIKGIMSIGKAFKIIDDQGNGTLDYYEFHKAMKDYGVELNSNEINVAFKTFDRNGTGTIDYEEFLRRVRGNMNSYRRGIVEQAFFTIDKNGNGYVDIDDLKGVYNASNHPDVLKGKKTQEEVLIEFLHTFDINHSIYNTRSTTTKITKEEFFEYYENVSMSIDDDAYFSLMMNNCWKLSSNTNKNNNNYTNVAISSNNINNLKSNQEFTNRYNSYNPLSNSYSYNPSKNIPQGTNYLNNSTNDSRMMGNPSMNQNNSTGNSNNENYVNSLLFKLRNNLNSRGAKGFIGLQRQFKIFDNEGNKKIDFEEFCVTLNQYQMNLNKNDMKLIFDYFDSDRTGKIDYDEFVLGIRGKMNDRRRKLVDLAFIKLDRNGNGLIEIDDIKYFYNTKQHPDVLYGKKTEKEVFEEFLLTFETHLNTKRGMSSDHKVTNEEFREYYDNVSASIDNDEYFELMITNSWQLNGSPIKNDNTNSYNNTNLQRYPLQGSINSKSQVRGDYRPQNVSQINPVSGNYKYPNNSSRQVPSSSNDYGISAKLNSANNYLAPLESLKKFRQKIAARGTKGILGLQRMFKIADDNGSGTIDSKEFNKLIKDFRVGLNDEEINQVYSIFDRNGNNNIDYDEFLRGIAGEMNEYRKNIVKKVFTRMDQNQNGVIEISDIKGLYNSSRHPDVISGKKTEEDVLGEWLDNFDQYSYLKGNTKRDHTITLTEFLEYYNNISMSIDDDRYFELMMNNCWNLDGKRNFSNAGSNIMKNIIQYKY